MKRPVIIILSSIAILLVVVGAIYALYRREPTAAPVASSQSSVSPTATIAEELITWTDQAGFSFSYPKNLTVNKHDEDQENYAHIEFTDPAHPGTLVIWAKDTTAADAAGWVKSDKSLTGGVVIDTKLGGLEAKKILVNAGESKRVVVGTVSDQIAFSLDANMADSAYWQHILDTVSGSFVFTPASGAESGEGAPAEEQPADEEEEVTYLGLRVA